MNSRRMMHTGLMLVVSLVLAVSALGVLPVPRAAAATITWNGSSSTDWNTAANWSGGVPTATDDVIIGNWTPGGPLRQPTLGASTTIKSLTIRGRSGTGSTRGGCLTISSGYTLTISGGLAINGSTGTGSYITCGGSTAAGINASSGSGSLSVGGNVTFTNATAGSEVPILVMGSGRLQVAGNWTKGTSATFPAGTSAVTFNGTGTQNLTADSATRLNDLTVNSGITLTEMVDANNVTVGGTLTNNGTISKTRNIGTTGVYTFGLASGPVNGAYLSMNVITDTFTSFRVEYVGSRHQYFTGPDETSGVGYARYWTLTPNGTGTVNLTLPLMFTAGGTSKVCRYTGGGGYGWDCVVSSINGATVTRNGVTSFSDWAAGNVGPTAITLIDLSARPSGLTLPVLLLAGVVILAGVFVLVARKRNR
jgi:hypothetical protein